MSYLKVTLEYNLEQSTRVLCMSKTGSTRGRNAPNIEKTNPHELEKAKKVGVKGSPLIWQRTALSSNTLQLTVR